MTRGKKRPFLCVFGIDRGDGAGVSRLPGAVFLLGRGPANSKAEHGESEAGPRGCRGDYQGLMGAGRPELDRADRHRIVGPGHPLSSQKTG